MKTTAAAAITMTIENCPSLLSEPSTKFNTI